MKSVFLIFTLFILLSVAIVSRAQEEEDLSDRFGFDPSFRVSKELNFPTRNQEDDSISARFGFYNQADGSNDSGGNSFVDEEETVYEAIIVLDKTISERDRLNVRLLGDLVSSASIAKMNNPTYRSLQSNPSGNKRGEVGLGWNHRFDEFSLGGNASISAEFSRYYSTGYGSNISFPFNHDNTTFGFSFQGYYDHFQNKTFSGQNDGYVNRQSYTLDGNLTQVLTPKTIFNLNIHYTQQLGYLATTYYSVLVGGVEMQEVAPDNRRRNAFTGRIKRNLTFLSSLELGYRFYNDSWDINSHTIDTRFSQYIWKRKMILEPNYRFYIQDSAFFYQKVFIAPQTYMTSDPDLGSFNGHIFGLKAVLLRPDFLPIGNADLDSTFNYYLRSDHLNIFWITAGYTLRF